MSFLQQSSFILSWAAVLLSVKARHFIRAVRVLFDEFSAFVVRAQAYLISGGSDGGFQCSVHYQRDQAPGDFLVSCFLLGAWIGECFRAEFIHLFLLLSNMRLFGWKFLFLWLSILDTYASIIYFLSFTLLTLLLVSFMYHIHANISDLQRYRLIYIYIYLQRW